MTWLTWVLLLGYIALSFALYRLFPKAGKAASAALIPGYNMWIVAELVGRKPWHALWLLIPYLNVFIFAGLMVDLARSFGRFSFGEHVLAVITSWGYFGWLGAKPEVRYNGPILEVERAYRQELAAAEKTKEKREINKVHAAYPQFQKPFYQDWAEAAIFAIFAAAFIRLLLIESYIIPTPSMEGNLNVGDFLFVSKIHYGLRLPETLLMIPLAHNRAPLVGGESYIEGAELPYRRLPALEAIDRYDPVVFNVPAGDSVYVTPARTYYPHDVRTGFLPANVARAVESGQLELITRPRDKRDHYVKRAIGLPGEVLEIKDRQVFIDGQPIADPENVQYFYKVTFSTPPNRSKWSDMGISSPPGGDDVYQENGNLFIIRLNQAQIDWLKGNDPQATFEPVDQSGDKGIRFYPHNERYFGEMQVDNYGPVKIPARGMTIKLDERTHALYWRAIKVYEENPSYTMLNGQFFLDNQPITEYTFQQDYYWMMGDNRHNSEDSRIWGFVPEDHILGKPLFVWFSIKEGNLFNGINWHRIGRNASKQGGR
ncbi:signal peptidase I [Neolewinella lacunae]|uniref:Signal peptidase I n=1 Tax=Neolewinella lacunae TaxID=1517758 RepID=A0A923PKU9_9BACT|nr:signal peptidase I [Neolewinella lacunae]MBC6996008.1 signal peptidase I [Neolewinella lacunae]MDN3633182.1 signal peptidase I [Neolewinella lacunae]